MKKRVIFVLILVALICFAVGRNMFMGYMMSKRQMPVPAVELIDVKQVDIIDKKEVIGRVASKYSVGLNARVSGYLQKRYFNEGSYVRKGALLFQIEPDQYQIAVKQAEANLLNAEAGLTEAEKNFVRMKELLEKGCISKSTYDSALATRDRANASVEMQKAMLDSAKLNLNYTKIYAPVSGRISDLKITEGNLITPAAGTLASITSLNPIYVSFNLTSSEFLELQNKKKLGSRKIEIKLPNGQIYDHQGIENFYNNQIDPTTGTIKVRATLKNPDQLLLPGQFVAVTIYSKDPVKKLVVPQEAVLENPTGKFVYVLNEENIVGVKSIKVSGAHNGNWIIENGLELDESIVFKGLQKIRPEMKVNLLSDEQVNKKPQKPTLFAIVGEIFQGIFNKKNNQKKGN